MSVADVKLETMRIRLARVSETVNETVIFSNKTYFMEEISALRETNAKIKAENYLTI